MGITLELDFQTQEERVTDGVADGITSGVARAPGGAVQAAPERGRAARPPQARYAAVFAVVTAGIAVVNLDRLRTVFYVDTLPVCK
jgi:hypothetical protein